MHRRTLLKAMLALALAPGLAIRRRRGGGTHVRNGWILGEDDA